MSFRPATFYFLNSSKYTREITNPNACIVCIESGRARITYNGESFDLLPTDAFFIPSFCSYSIEFTGDPEIKYRAVFFQIKHLTGFDSSKSYKVQKLSVKNPSEFADRLSQIYGEHEEGNILSAMAQFLMMFEEIKDTLEFNEKSFSETSVEPAVEYIDRHWAQKTTDSFLAGLCHLSVSRFHTLFKDAKKMTPFQYKNGIAIHHAQMMLRSEKNLSIESVAEKCGFASSSFFRKLFLRTVGLTPREFRKRAGEWIL